MRGDLDEDAKRRGADVCERLDRVLRESGRTPEAVQRASWIAGARELGVEQAKNAASWVYDGNSDRTERAKVLAMMRDGDPEAQDYLPDWPNLSGEWANDPTPKSLVEDITGLDALDAQALDGELENDLATAYEDGVDETFEQECERLLIEFCEPPLSDSDLGEFVDGYIECALWSSTDQTREDGGDPLDRNYKARDIDCAALESMVKDSRDFTSSEAIGLQAYCEQLPDGGAYNKHEGTPLSFAGHDFWLTRNGHGAGFWDRGLGDIGTKLSDAARVYGTVDLMPGEDGKLYI